MKRLPTNLLLMLAAFAVVTCRSRAMDYMIFPVPDLVARSSVIAEGRVALVGGKPHLEVRKVLKGGPIGRLCLVSRGIGLERPVKFVDGERVVVFLETPDASGNATLIGYGDQGKWPRPEGSSGYQKTYQGLTIEKTVSTIEAVLHALSGQGFEEQARRIIGMIQSKDEVLQLAGLETALSMTLSDPLPKAQRSSSTTQIAAFTLDLLASPNPEVRGSAIQLIGYAHNLVVTRALSPMVSDPDPHNRKLAITEVTAARYLPTGVRSFQARKPGSPAQDKVAADAEKQKWIVLYEQSRDRQIADLRKGLKSTSPLEREAAAIYLRYLNLEISDQ